MMGRQTYRPALRHREPPSLFERIDKCLDLCRVERKGISTDDIDWLIIFDRYIGTGHKLKSGDRARLVEILERVERSEPE